LIRHTVAYSTSVEMSQSGRTPATRRDKRQPVAFAVARRPTSDGTLLASTEATSAAIRPALVPVFVAVRWIESSIERRTKLTI
jgi:hypothetical protein